MYLKYIILALSIQGINACSSGEKIMISKIHIGGEYVHYSGKRYIVKEIVRDSDDLKLLVIYEGLYNDPTFGNHPVWSRPLSEFLEEVEIKGVKQPRFAHIEQSTGSAAR